MKNSIGRILYAPEGSEGGDNGVSEGVSPQAEPTGGEPRVFTQEELNQIVGERATRAKQTAVADLLKELGFSKLTELKDAIAQQRKAEQASMSELEKAQAALKELEAKAAAAEQGRKAALIRAAVISQAGALRFNNAEDALAFLKMESLEISEDGQIEGLQRQLEAIAKERPYLLQQPGQVGATNPGRGSTEGETAAQKRARLWGAGDTDPLMVNGGVYWPSERR